jgi:hypothetical protein
MTLADYISAHLAKRFEYGKLDCVLFAAGWLTHATGRDYLADVPRWSTKKQAMRIIRDLGGLEAAMDAKLRRIHPNLAADGHIGMYKGRACIFSGPHIVGPGYDGLIFINRLEAEAAWSY